MKSKKDALKTLDMMLAAEEEVFNKLMESDGHKLSSESAQYLIVASANLETLTKMVVELVRDSVDNDDVSRRVYTGPKER